MEPFSLFGLIAVCSPGIVGLANFHLGAFVVGTVLGLAALLVGMLWWPIGAGIWLLAWFAAFSAVRQRDRRRDEERRHQETLAALRKD